MGIRFFCPNGHKMNVKAFLAGKRGICPKCGAKFDIPLESDPAAAPPVLHHPPTAAPQPAPGANAAAAAMSGATTGGAAQQPALPGHMPASFVPQPATPIHQPTFPAPAGGGWQAPQAGFSAPDIPPAPRAAPIAPAPVDPIAEAPQAVWYVRPAAGGQYGPAPADVMRQWIMQKRVGADSMVWREGWPDWRRASVAFPSLAAQMPAATASQPMVPVAPLPSPADDWMDAIVDSGSSDPAGRVFVRAHKKKDNNLWIILSAIAIVVGIAVLAVLISSAMRERKKEKAETGAMIVRPVTGLVALESHSFRKLN